MAAGAVRAAAVAAAGAAAVAATGSTRRTCWARARRTTARRARPKRSTSTAARRSCCTRRPSRSSSVGQHDGRGDLARPQVAALHDGHDRAGIRSSSCRRRAGRPCRSRRRRASTGARRGRTTASKIAWDANTADKPGTRHIEIATIGDDPAKATIVTVTSGSGTNTSAQWSPDDKRILYQHTDYQNSADLYVADAVANAKPTRLTSSMPSSIDKSILVAPAAHALSGPGWQVGAGVALRAEESRPHEEARGDRLDSSRTA